MLLINPYPALSRETIANSQTTGYICMKDTMAPLISSYLLLYKSRPHLANGRQVVSLALAALSSARRMLHVLRMVNPESDEPVDVAELEEAEGIFRNMPSLPGQFFRVVWDQLEEGYPAQQESGTSATTFDLASLGLEGYEWLFQSDE